MQTAVKGIELGRNAILVKVNQMVRCLLKALTIEMAKRPVPAPYPTVRGQIRSIVDYADIAVKRLSMQDKLRPALSPF